MKNLKKKNGDRMLNPYDGSYRRSVQEHRPANKYYRKIKYKKLLCQEVELELGTRLR